MKKFLLQISMWRFEHLKNTINLIYFINEFFNNNINKIKYLFIFNWKRNYKKNDKLLILNEVTECYKNHRLKITKYILNCILS